MNTPLNASEIERLDLRQCLTLLRSQAVGRLVFTEQALPAIRLVNYSMPTGRIVLRLGHAKWVARLDRTVVAFEVDDFDAGARTGWSVVIVGKARLILDIDELVSLNDPAARSWAPGPRDQVVSIDMERVTGRRIRVTASAS
ncbi:pyridoxamine 5'-phosphate oxidase family protein [Amycolatopsis pigmentata]|uniref:Pyridoxamine 5'-phosphate oxidase family protein n=1 Tax=Amycolatopsis pigmentata TaxID=450801 RepID=A0ABW5FR34_9PSEU